MINLLPIDEKKAVRREYQLALLTVWFTSISALMLLAIVLLGSIYFIVRAERDGLEQELASLAPALVNTDEVSQELTVLERRLGILTLPETAYAPTTAINNVLGVRSSGIRLATMNYDVREGGRATMTLSGIASNRAALLKFISGLRAVEMFADVTTPVSDLAENENLDFSATITVSEKEIHE